MSVRQSLRLSFIFSLILPVAGFSQAIQTSVATGDVWLLPNDQKYLPPPLALPRTAPDERAVAIGDVWFSPQGCVVELCPRQNPTLASGSLSVPQSVLPSLATQE